nr:unnamed protein product [Digitaria exilis]
MATLEENYGASIRTPPDLSQEEHHINHCHVVSRSWKARFPIASTLSTSVPRMHVLSRPPSYAYKRGREAHAKGQVTAAQGLRSSPPSPILLVKPYYEQYETGARHHCWTYGPVAGTRIKTPVSSPAIGATSGLAPQSLVCAGVTKSGTDRSIHYAIAGCSTGMPFFPPQRNALRGALLCRTASHGNRGRGVGPTCSRAIPTTGLRRRRREARRPACLAALPASPPEQITKSKQRREMAGHRIEAETTKSKHKSKIGSKNHGIEAQINSEITNWTQQREREGYRSRAAAASPLDLRLQHRANESHRRIEPGRAPAPRRIELTRCRIDPGPGGAQVGADHGGAQARAESRRREEVAAEGAGELEAAAAATRREPLCSIEGSEQQHGERKREGKKRGRIGQVEGISLLIFLF